MTAYKGRDFLLKIATGSLTGTVNTTSDEITTNSAHGWATGQAIELTTTGSLPAATPALALATIYYARVTSSTKITLHPTLADANANTNKINLTSSGSGTLGVKELTTLGGLQMTRFSGRAEPVIVTNKNSDGWQELADGIPNLQTDIAASGKYWNDEALDLLRGYADAGSLNPMHLFMGTGDTISGYFQVSSFGYDGEHKDAQGYDIALASSAATSIIDTSEL